jgi:excisionase family DNA binding protein
MSTNKQDPTAALLAYADAQKYLGGISRSTLKALVGKGVIRSIAIGTRRLFPRDELQRYISVKLHEEL